MKFFAVIVAFISLYDAILCVTFKDCGSTDGTVSSVSVKGCSSSDARCIFKTGTDEEITIQFKSNVDTSSASIKLTGVIGGLVIPWQTIDGCAKGGLSCPIKSGSSNQLKFGMPISSSFPKVTLDAKIELTDDNGKDLLCQIFPAKLE